MSRPRSTRGWVAAALSAACVVAAVAQDGGGDGVVGPGSGPVSDLLTSHLAEDDPQRPELLREGIFIVQRRGRVKPRPGGGWSFEFLPPAPGSGQALLPEMVLQPSQRLEAMLAAINAEAEPILFTLTGQVHVYDGANHLLPTELAGFTEVDGAAAGRGGEPVSAEPTPVDLGAPAPSPAEADPPTGRGPLRVEDLLEPEVAGGIGGTPGEPEVAAPAAETPEDLMAALAAERDRGSGAPVLSLSGGPVPEPPPTQAASATGGAAEQVRRREGDLLIQRAVRVAAPDEVGPQTGTRPPTQLNFVADRLATPEPPVEVLPSRLRTRLERQSRRSGPDTVFLVSGRIYRFQDRDYFLPTTVRVRPDTGRLAD